MVDDYPETLDLIKTYLETFEKVNVITCLSGQEALDEYSQKDFALILLDVDMPNMDGFEVARKMKEMNLEYQAPIIYITGVDRERKRAATGYEVGAVDYILKPINMEFLLSKARVFLGLFYSRKKLEDQISEKVTIENELKQSNQKIKSIIDGMPECVFTFDKRGVVESINTASLQLLGMEVPENILGINLSQWIFPTDKNKFITALKKAGRGEEVLVSIRFQTVKNDQKRVEFTVTAIKETGKVKSLVGLAIDTSLKTKGKLKNSKSSGANGKATNSIESSHQSNAETEVEFGNIMEEKVKNNVNSILRPMLEKLKTISPENKVYLEMIASSMGEITSSLDENTLKEFNNLNSKEIEILTLMKKGMTIKEIAEKLNKSVRNISLHSSQISKKLGAIKKKKIPPNHAEGIDTN